MMAVRSRDQTGERVALPIHDKVTFGARFRAIGGVRPGGITPDWPGCSHWPRSPSASRSAPLCQVHRAASGASDLRRPFPARRAADAVTSHPHPRPNLTGKKPLGMLALRTKRISVRHARSGTQWAPRLGSGGTLGNRWRFESKGLREGVVSSCNPPANLTPSY